MSDKFENVGSRISARLKELNMKQTELCKKTGLSTNAVSQYVRNLRIPDTMAVFKISKALNVQIEWLLTGDTLQQNTTNECLNSETDSCLNEIEYDIIDMFRVLDERDQEDVYESIKLKYDRTTKKGRTMSLYSTYTDTNEDEKSDTNGKNSTSGIA